MGKQAAKKITLSEPQYEMIEILQKMGEMPTHSLNYKTVKALEKKGIVKIENYRVKLIKSKP